MVVDAIEMIFEERGILNGLDEKKERLRTSTMVDVGIRHFPEI